MNTVTHFSSPEQPWGKSHTPKRYLHPPFAENIITMWPNTTILISEIQGGNASQHSCPGKSCESVLPSAMVAFYYRHQLPDYRKAAYQTREDGIPIHTIIQDLGAFTLTMESFCSTQRVPVAYTRLTIRNTQAAAIHDQIAMIARTGMEFDLLGAADADGYYPLEPSLNRIKCLTPWTCTEHSISDQTYTAFFRANEEISIRISKDNLALPQFEFTLEAGAETTLYVSFGRSNQNAAFSYEEEKQRTIAFWEQELARIEVFPQKEEPAFYTMYRSLVAQGLQMFDYPQGLDYVLMRQGGLQRRIWPTENRSMLEALLRIGDFEPYISAVMKTYFTVMQDDTGEVINFGIPWGAITGSVLDSFSSAALKYPQIYEAYKEHARKAFLWMEEMRASTRDVPGQTPGLFPPRKASDYPGVVQMWGMTDVWNLTAYEHYAQLLRTMQDPHAAEVATAAADYRTALEAIFRKAAEAQKDDDKLILPMDANNNPDTEAYLRSTSLADGFFNEVLAVWAGLGDACPGAAEKLLHYRLHTLHYLENGMTFPFERSGASYNGRRWYGNWLEYKLYFYYRRLGEDAKAKKLLDAQLRYNMTPEYYMSERYDDCDPWYIPWCPNCSANGRTLLMLCDWYL